MTDLAPLFDALRDVLRALGEDFEIANLPARDDAEERELELA